MAAQNELWIPLVDEPIGSIVEEIESRDPEIASLVRGPRRTLAFKTFAYVKVGLLLGELLVDTDVESVGELSWAQQLLGDPATQERVRVLLREIAEEVAADSSYDDDDLVPDDGVRERFRAFAKKLRSE
jgi:hypothetical protein